PCGLPQGYRQGIITAITVLLGFSLTFRRFWGFEAAGKWTVRSLLSTGPLVVAVGLQILALFRALRLADDDAKEYHQTVLSFLASAVVLLLGLLLAIVELALQEQPPENLWEDHAGETGHAKITP